ncbi:nitrous oxide reductase family maturation protein NosD [Sphingobacterium psychroaquaticum]|uniref:Nitrous oxidase accessory protein n=1 Tax=Sphingobacterium psychroaquaticum TaxID=561061 RepID=A0A1X7INJ5_9SPHI|nr:nitrous oxide reductase family maturation protein NosD [Sphingobacterium psychroaquaticum]SMG16324.1 nitrous oxidase accessory protein [Sphingobacterium psychroaquaticum]
MKSFYLLKQVVFTYLMVCGSVYAATIKVGNAQVIKSITKAISLAQPGDTILVDKGRYSEGTITIDKPLTLIGKAYPTIDGKKKYEPFSVKSSHVTIRGFLVKSSGHSSLTDIAGIKVYNTTNVRIADNILEDNFFGVYFQASKNCIAENNKIKAYGSTEQLSGNGIHAWKSDSLTIFNNTVKGHRDGIYLEFVTHTKVEKNQSTNNIRYGLHFMFSHDNAYLYNEFTHNGAGVAVMYTKRVRMLYNTFNENWGDSAYGLLLKDITDSEIRHNRFIKNTTAIFMEGSNRIHIENNQLESNGWALKIQASCMDNTLVSNNFINNTFDVTTNNMTLAANNFNQNYWDKYEGYDLNKDGLGDVPYRPVSLFSVIVEQYPMAMLLFRSFMSKLLDRTERVMPSLTPENLMDENPYMKPLNV